MGGTEFVSSSLAKFLISKDYIVDIFTRGIKTHTYKGINIHHKGNRKFYSDLEKTIKNIKYEYVFDISAYTLEDVETLYTALDKSALKRYIFCSSGAVYKESKNLINENYETGYNLNWKEYGLDKLKAEEYLMEKYNEFKFPVVIFRPTYIYGPQNNLYRECYFFDRLNTNQPIPFPSGNTLVQFIYIDDLINTFVSAIHEKKCIGQTYNLTNPEYFSWENLIDYTAIVVGKEKNIKLISEEKVSNIRQYFPFRNYTYLLNIDKLINDNLYEPKVGILEGLKRSYAWYLHEKPNLKDSKMNKIEYVLED